MSVALHEGDCLEVLKSLADNSVDSVVTDPPYSIGFMSKKWDYSLPTVEVWCEVIRVLKPGGHLLSFSSTRTYHRMAVAIEDAGFEIRDQIGFMYGSGMPKSKNGLKPAWEPIALCRKPLIGSVAVTVAAFGTGEINIEDCRVPVDGVRPARSNIASKSGLTGTGGAVTYGAFAVRGSIAIGETSEGRWPANVIHDGSDEVMEAFAQYGDRGAAAPVKGTEPSHTGDANTVCYGEFGRVPGTFYGDTGSAARFFMCSKATKAERAGSKHPTVKPISLMRYLCRLITPKGGIVLDPFAGTGTTGQAAIDEGFSAILIEREAEYCQDIRRRLALYLDDPTVPSLIQFG